MPFSRRTNRTKITDTDYRFKRTPAGFVSLTLSHTKHMKKSRIAVGSLSALCLPLRYFCTVRQCDTVLCCSVRCAVCTRISRGSIHFGVFALGRLQTLLSPQPNDTTRSSCSVQPWSSTYSVTASQRYGLYRTRAFRAPLPSPQNLTARQNV